MVRETIILNRSSIAEFVDPATCVDNIEQAMREFEKGNDFLPPKHILSLPFTEQPALLAAITGYTASTNALTIKLGHERSANIRRGLPTTISWVNLFDPDTGELLMICDGTLPTMLRTAAAAAVSTRHLARKDVEVLVVVGVGQLGRQCVRAVSSVRKFKKILVCDQNAEFAAKVAAELNQEISAPVEFSEIEAACRQADVLVTATNSRAPIVKNEWVKTGTHIAGMGTDLHDKIELEMELAARCRRFADMVEHAVLRGEVSQAIEAGLIHKDTCFVGSLGQVLNGAIPGRTSDDEITLYDGVGIGIQDTTIARVIYDQAVAADKGSVVRFDA